VAISRAFDIEGVWEVLCEISADCQSPITRNFLNLAKEDVAVPESISGQSKTGVIGNTNARNPGREIEAGTEKGLEIGDSEEDEEDFEFADSPEEVTNVVPDNTNVIQSTSISLSREPGPSLKKKPPEGKERTEIIVIDNMTTPINELFSRREKSFGKSQTI
jgi:hypothetical protein